ncbi:DUF1990 family protein [uncultured Hymenobacter sp.]|uniref:DUF1990 family protein n=1 Tax=uncultured Hymenobacter sp. TaxID=170016 RepID=UPI0035CA29C6
MSTTPDRARTATETAAAQAVAAAPNATAAAQLLARYRSRLLVYQDAPVNFDAERLADFAPANGWNVDDYAISLPPEPAGTPRPNGSFAAAQTVLRRYSFPPPQLLTGIFDPSQPLENRLMLLRGRFLGFSFWFGVRVGGVWDEVRDTAAGPEQVWGYFYRTLQGHFERGQIDFTLHKNLTSGQVTFRIHAVSQTGRIRNPFYWLGFKLFGRRLQRRFARASLWRLQQQVREMLGYLEG